MRGGVKVKGKGRWTGGNIFLYVALGLLAAMIIGAVAAPLVITILLLQLGALFSSAIITEADLAYRWADPSTRGER